MSTNKSTEADRPDTDDGGRFWAQLRANIQELLEKRQMTQTRLAHATGIPYSTLNKKLRGVHKTWSVTDFVALYGAFDGDEILFRGLTESARASVAAGRS